MDKTFIIPKLDKTKQTPPPAREVWRVGVSNKSTPKSSPGSVSVDKLKPENVHDPTPVSPGTTPYESKPGTSFSENDKKPITGPTLPESPGTSSPESSNEEIQFDPEKLKNMKKEQIEKEILLQEEEADFERLNRNKQYDKLIMKNRKS